MSKPRGDSDDGRTSSSLHIQRSFEATIATRLLDVSPLMSGLTSDSDYADYGAPVDKGKRRDVPNEADSPSREHLRTDNYDSWEQDNSDSARWEAQREKVCFSLLAPWLWSENSLLTFQSLFPAATPPDFCHAIRTV